MINTYRCNCDRREFGRWLATLWRIPLLAGSQTWKKGIAKTQRALSYTISP
jgi:hypothetical protein